MNVCIIAKFLIDNIGHLHDLIAMTIKASANIPSAKPGPA